MDSTTTATAQHGLDLPNLLCVSLSTPPGRCSSLTHAVASAPHVRANCHLRRPSRDPRALVAHRWSLRRRPTRERCTPRATPTAQRTRVFDTTLLRASSGLPMLSAPRNRTHRKCTLPFRASKLARKAPSGRRPSRSRYIKRCARNRGYAESKPARNGARRFRGDLKHRSARPRGRRLLAREC